MRVVCLWCVRSCVCCVVCEVVLCIVTLLPRTPSACSSRLYNHARGCVLCYYDMQLRCIVRGSGVRETSACGVYGILHLHPSTLPLSLRVSLPQMLLATTHAPTAHTPCVCYTTQYTPTKLLTSDGAHTASRNTLSPHCSRPQPRTRRTCG